MHRREMEKPGNVRQQSGALEVQFVSEPTEPVEYHYQPVGADTVSISTADYAANTPPAPAKPND